MGVSPRFQASEHLRSFEMVLAGVLEQELSWGVKTAKEQAGSERDQHGLEALLLTPALHPALLEA